MRSLLVAVLLLAAAALLALAAPTLAVETDAAERLGLEFTSTKTLGISQLWNMEETRRHFAAAGIKEEFTYYNDSNISTEDPEHHRARYESEGLQSFLLQKVWLYFEDLIARDIPWFRENFRLLGLQELPTKCLFFQNAIAKRDDIQVVAVCFAHFFTIDPKTGQKVKRAEHQFLVAAAFRKDKITLPVLKSHLQDVYGEPYETNTKDLYGKTGVATNATWLMKPWYYAGLLTKNYIYLSEPEGYLPEASSVLMYVNMNGLGDVYVDIRRELEKLQEAEKQAKEKAKQEQRKGL